MSDPNRNPTEKPANISTYAINEQHPDSEYNGQYYFPTSSHHLFINYEQDSTDCPGMKLSGQHPLRNISRGHDDSENDGNHKYSNFNSVSAVTIFDPKPKSQDGEIGWLQHQSSRSCLSVSKATHELCDESVHSADSTDSCDPFLVTWSGNPEDDTENVQLTASPFQKTVYTVVVCFATVVVTCSSSVYSMTMPSIAHEFGIEQTDRGRTTVALGMTLYLLGMAIGPLFYAPFSETYGRKPVYTFSFLTALAANFGCAFAPTLAGMLGFRFLTGLFGSGFIGVAAGSISDLYATSVEMQVPSMLFTCSPVIGPVVGPILAGAIISDSEDVGRHSEKWRWVFHAISVALTVSYLLVALVVPETCLIKLLGKKAQRIRKRTGDWRYHTLKNINTNSSTGLFVVGAKVYQILKKPFVLLYNEPMLALLCGYSGLLLAVMYLFFVSYPRVFSRVYGFSTYHVGLAFCGLLVGSLTAIPSVWVSCWYIKRIAFPKAEKSKEVTGSRVVFDDVKHDEKQTDPDYFTKTEMESGCNDQESECVYEPEYQLFQTICGSFVVPIGLFIFAWSATPHVPWIVPVVGGGIVIWASVVTSNGIYTYTLIAWGGKKPTVRYLGGPKEILHNDSKELAASAMACNGLVRSIMGGVAPLVGPKMYEKMGAQWAGTLVACMCVVYIPLPILLFKYGKRIREKSMYAS